MKFFNCIIGGIFFMIACTACRSTKKISTAINKKDTTASVAIVVKANAIDSAAIRASLLKRILYNKIDCNWFSAKNIKIEYEDNSGQNNNATANIRIKKDSIIWVSVTKKVLGIDFEGLRVLITKDSVKVLNKLEKIIQFRSINYLQELTHLPFNFYNLQDFILGNPVYFSENIVSYRQSDNRVLALSIGNIFKHLLTIDTTTNYIIHSKLDDADTEKNRTCDITLDDYENTKGKVFSTYRKISVTERSRLDIILDFKQYSFDEPQTFPFNIPKNYKVQ